MSKVFISEDDIRLQLSIWNNTLIRFTNDIELEKDDNISVLTMKKPKENNIKDDDRVYIIEDIQYEKLKQKVNIIYSSSKDYNLLLGAAYGTDILISEDKEIVNDVMINQGKFKEVYILNEVQPKVEHGIYPEIKLDLSESIIQSYSGFINYLEEISDSSGQNGDKILKNDGLFTLLFPTDIKVPNEDEQSIDFVLTRDETESLIESGDEELVKKCSIFTNSKFITKLLNSMFLILQLFGIFFIDNQFNIFNYSLFDKYIVKGNDRITQIFLRMLISLNTFNLISSHDNLKDFLLIAKNEYEINTKSSENWLYY